MSNIIPLNAFERVSKISFKLLLSAFSYPASVSTSKAPSQMQLEFSPAPRSPWLTTHDRIIRLQMKNVRNLKCDGPEDQSRNMTFPRRRPASFGRHSAI